MMIRNLIPTAAGILLLIFAVTITGCQEGAEQAERSAEPAVETTETDQAQVDAMVQSYLSLRQLLANDQLDGVPEELAEIGRAAQPLADSSDAQVRELARGIAERAAAQPDDLEKARETFGTVSAALIDLVKVVPPSEAVGEKLYVAFCPMAKASWLQATDELDNPYMGQKMLKCGEVRETIATS